mmetsp:Transcript_56967/g.123807  ORF Transcript_56967/g.123807 Transcript_56967/m.123807 type:complete len:125 (+) Transcript_56967:148-522(+)
MLMLVRMMIVQLRLRVSLRLVVAVLPPLALLFAPTASFWLRMATAKTVLLSPHEGSSLSFSQSLVLRAAVLTLQLAWMQRIGIAQTWQRRRWIAWGSTFRSIATVWVVILRMRPWAQMCRLALA